jgi:hypothetical protein
MKGLMTPGVSAGSKKVGASEMCTAHVSWPLGAADAGPKPVKEKSSARRTVIRPERAVIVTVP